MDNPVQIGINTDPSDSSEGPQSNQCLVEDFYWPVQDANFSCVGLVASDGTLEERYEYTPYGERTVYMRAGSADEKTSAPLYESQRVEVASVRQPYGLCDFGHQGLALDKEFGQYYNRSRQFLFRSARFLNRDPLGYSDGMSLYQYVGSGPIGLTDPMGLRLMGPQDPGYQPGYEKLPWKDVPETEKKCPGGGGGGEGVPAREQPPGGAAKPEAGQTDRRNQSTGASQFDWKKGGLKDYNNPFWDEEASYAEIFSGTTDADLRRGLQWERDYERQTGRSAADNIDDYNNWYMLRRHYEALARGDPGAVILTDGVGSGGYLAVGLLGYYGVTEGAPAAYRALAPVAARAWGAGALKAKVAYDLGMSKAIEGTILLHQFANEAKPGRFAMGVVDGSVPGPIVLTGDYWYDSGLILGQKAEDVPTLIPTVWDALFGRESK